jgi:hypothetical protein
MEPVSPICTCGHPMHQHCGDGCYVIVNRESGLKEVFCACKVSGGQYDPDRDS